MSETETVRRVLRAKIARLRASIMACETVLSELDGDEEPFDQNVMHEDDEVRLATTIRTKRAVPTSAIRYPVNEGRVWPIEIKKIMASAGRPILLRPLVEQLRQVGMEFSGRNPNKLVSVKLNVMKKRGEVDNGPSGWFLTKK
jgi:hypothetical protein